jgi:methylamine dehydrogenase accessory protein MauD
MSVLEVVVGLLGALVVLNTVAVIGLIRQIGLLHLRVQPLSALRGAGGPALGAQLEFIDKPWELPVIAPEVDRIVLGFVSPTCSICGPLLPAFRSLARAAQASESVVLVTDTDEVRAAEYLTGKGIDLPFVAEPGSFETNEIPAAPFVVVSDASGIVLASGGVNTFEQIEWLLAESRLPQPDPVEAAPPVLAEDHAHIETNTVQAR